MGKATQEFAAKRLFMSPEEFAETTGLRIEHVWRLLRLKKLPAQRFGRWYRIPVTALGEAAALLEEDQEAGTR